MNEIRRGRAPELRRRGFLKATSLGIAGLVTDHLKMSVNAAAPRPDKSWINFQSAFDQHKIRPHGQWYESTVPDPLDLAKRAELAINVLTGNLEPERFYCVYQGFSFRPPEPQRRALTWNISPKNARALPWMRTMCGSEQNLDAEYHLMQAMVDQLANDGQVYVPADTDSVPKGTSNPVISGLLAMAAANWYERDKNPRLVGCGAADQPWTSAPGYPG
jgi:hypothetical protein